MRRFYFDYMPRGKCSASDNIGTELPDVRAAKVEAVAAVTEWLKDHARSPGAEIQLSVRDGKPAPVFVVTASIKVNNGSG
jgi:hypothetical protein